MNAKLAASEYVRSRRSKGIAQSELKSAWAARAKEFPRGVESVVESRRVNGIVDTRVVPVCCAPDVGDIEQIESLRYELQCMRLLKMKGPC